MFCCANDFITDVAVYLTVAATLPLSFAHLATIDYYCQDAMMLHHIILIIEKVDIMPATTNSTTSDQLRATAKQAEALKIALLEGYQDAVAGHGVVYQGNLRKAIVEAKQKDSADWRL